MANIPLVTVAVVCSDPSGNPAVGVEIEARLRRKDSHGADVPAHEIFTGVVVPVLAVAKTDNAGAAALRLFPNELGQRASFYEVTVNGPEGPITLRAVVPNHDCNLWDIVDYETFPVSYWSDKVAKPTTAVSGHFAAFDGSRGIVDSGYGPTELLSGGIEFFYPFDFGDATPTTLCTVAAGKRVLEAEISITTAFNGAGAGLSIGDADSVGNLMPVAFNAPDTAGTYSASPNYLYAVATVVHLYITPGAGATQGNGVVRLKIQP